MNRLFAFITLFAAFFTAFADNKDIADKSWGKIALRMSPQWYSSSEAEAVADTVLGFQMYNGGWPKNFQYHKPIPAEKLLGFSTQGLGATIDNNATNLEMRFLANVYANNPQPRFREAFLRGLDFLFEAQYPNGGWPQFFPPRPGEKVAYSAHITYNDNAMVNVLELLRDIAEQRVNFKALDIDETTRTRCLEAFNRGIECILATQIMVEGRPTVWCAQHDEVTLAPANARAYELASYSGAESVGIVELLMSLPNPSPRVVRAVNGAMDWFDSHKIKDMAFVHFRDKFGKKDSRLEPCPGNDLWARFYDLDTEQPFFCDRDGIKRTSLNEVGQERRGGYGWYTILPQQLYPLYEKWLQDNNLANKHRIIVSTDIGGTDADDNQSMLHLLMYSDLFDIEGLISTPSFGDGSKDEILRMIGVYENDFPQLQAAYPELKTPDELRALCYQGASSLAPYFGYALPTEGSQRIVEAARKNDHRPLYVLVWGSLEDVAQALHDAPDIMPKLRVYYIGGPNKKWGVNAYAYIAENFPDLWFIENNASYRGFTSNAKDPGEFHAGFYNAHLQDAGNIGADFINYYNGVPKMGDTPSLLYMMTGNPSNPEGDSWGGSFERCKRSSRRVIDVADGKETHVPVYSVVEFRLKGEDIDLPAGAPAFNLHIDNQDWDGYYLGEGEYAVRCSPKQPATLEYSITAKNGAFKPVNGTLMVDDLWPGEPASTDYIMGENWWTDKQDAKLFKGRWQGFKTVEKHRDDVFRDWVSRLRFL